MQNPNALTASPVMPTNPQAPMKPVPPGGNPFAGFNLVPGTNVPMVNPQMPSFGPPTTYAGADKVSISPDILNSMSQYSDAAYQNATRTLDPQWQQQKAAFDQQMVGQGIQPGSQAYDAAFANFSRSQNDAYAQARNQAMQQGLQAQGQAFGEGYQNSSLANELEKARMAADASMYDASMTSGAQTQSAQIAADASMKNNALNNQTTQLADLGQLGLGYGNLQLGQGNLQLGQQRLGLDSSNSDFNNLMGMLNYGRQGDVYNNTLPGTEENMMLPFMSQIPNGNPYNVDVTGAYGLNANMQNNQYMGNVNSANATNQTLGQLGSAAVMMMMLSSRTLKDDLGAVDEDEILDAVSSLPVHRWRYKGEDTDHIGTFAEDFNRQLKLAETKAIAVPDAFGALMACVKAINAKLDALDSRLVRLEQSL